jgi:ketosteroid isomerase-like protein
LARRSGSREGHHSDFYAVFYKERDKQKYRSLLTDDYLLLENGELMDADGDLALMPTPEDQYTRKDEFDFRHVKVSGDSAYAVYVLNSDMQDKKHGARSGAWLESAVLRRVDGRWRVAVLHSTRIMKRDRAN